MSELIEQTRRLKWSYVREIEPHRPALYRYCRRLTGNPFDAEDLHQETVLRAFSKLAERFEPVRQPRAYLFRVATNLWIDWCRRAPNYVEASPEEEPAAAPPPAVREVVDGVETLLHTLPPREASALVLRDVFEFSVHETASLLSCTEAAVKMATSRARKRLKALGSTSVGEPGGGRRPVPDLIERFAVCFQRRDAEALLELIDEHAHARVLGCAEEHGRDEIRRGSLRRALESAAFTRVSVEAWHDVPVLMVWYDDRVGDMLRLGAEGGRIVRLDYYYFSPDFLKEACTELGHPCRDNGYAVFERGWWNTEP